MRAPCVRGLGDRLDHVRKRGIRHPELDGHLRERKERGERLERIRTLAVGVEHHGNRRLGGLERGDQERLVREWIASTDGNRIEFRTRKLPLQFAHERRRSVHRGRFRFAGEAHEQLPPSNPNTLCLDAGRYSRQRCRCHRCARHRISPESFGPSPLASFTIRSHSSGNVIPAVAAAWGIRLSFVIPGSVFASRQ